MVIVSNRVHVTPRYSRVQSCLFLILGWPDHRHKCVSKMVRVGLGQCFEWIEGFATKKKCIGLNLIHVTVSQKDNFF